MQESEPYTTSLYLQFGPGFDEAFGCHNYMKVVSMCSSIC